MRYTMKPAGHKAPEEKREYTVRPNRKLQSVFEEWLDRGYTSGAFDNDFTRATTALTNLEATVEEAHGLIITYKNHPKIISAGLFLSAIYQYIPEQQITYDLDIPISWLGYKLPAGKTLINNGTTGRWMGDSASGPVINNGTTRHSMGYEASGPVINNGETGTYMGECASGPVINNGTTGDRMGGGASGIVLALKEPKSYGAVSHTWRIFKPEQIESNPELHAYLTALCEQTKAFTTESVIPPNFADRITQEIERLL